MLIDCNDGRGKGIDFDSRRRAVIMGSVRSRDLLRNRTLTIGWLGLLVLGLASFLIVLMVGRPWREGLAGAAWLAVVAFALWAVTPHVGLGAALVLFRRTPKRAVAGVSAALAVALVGLACIIDVVFVHPDPQGGIALIFVPLCQWIGVAALSVFGAASFLSARAGGADPTPGVSPDGRRG